VIRYLLVSNQWSSRWRTITIPDTPTTNIPIAAELLGVGRNQGYEAARRGEIPTIALGKRRVVPTAWLRRVLSGEIVPNKIA
jgi:hypothetical protein